MVSPNSFLIIQLLACILLIVASSFTEALKRIPEPFNEKKLPSSQRDGQQVEHLGKVLSLQPYFSAPESVDPYGTKFTIYNRAKPEPTEIQFSPNRYCHSECHGPFQYDLELIEESKINASLKTVIMVSGFLSGEKIDWMESIKDDWLEMEDVNVVLVTWKDSNRYRYEFAAGATTMVSRQVTIFLHYVAELQGMSLLDSEFASKIHFVGHSLGAHIAGFVGQDFGGRMGHITGLDPSGPGFNGVPVGRRLDKSDAYLVDVIHTNSGKMAGYKQLVVACMSEAVHNIFLPHLTDDRSRCPEQLDGEPRDSWRAAWFGVNMSCGHLDFYPNGGREQPGCTGDTHRCDHGRSHELFADLLKLELARRRLGGSMPRAFRAADYEHFIGGSAMHLHCDQLDGCSLPMDLFSPADQIKRNLRLKHWLDVDAQSEVKLYFRSRDSKPFVGDHHLLSLHLKTPVSWKEDECRLKLEGRMPDGERVPIGSLSHLSMTRNEDGSFVMALPFVAPAGSRYLADASSQDFDKVRAALPSQLHISLELTKQTARLSDSLKSTVKWLFNWGEQKPRCYLDIAKVEVRPMISVGDHKDKTLTANYGHELRLLENSFVLNSNDVTQATEQLMMWTFH